MTNKYNQLTNNYAGTSDFLNPQKLANFPAVKDGWLNKIYDNTNNTLLYNSDNTNMKMTECILDSKNVWDGLYKTDFAKWVIGSPTLELTVKSYLWSNPSATISIPNLNSSDTGYAYSNTGIDEVFAHNTVWNHGVDYWISNPSLQGNTYLLTAASNIDKLYSATDFGNQFRPIVCLKSTTVLTKNPSTSKFDLTKAE